jgi:NIMA (never in mitosis gene a)-related kinase
LTHDKKVKIGDLGVSKIISGSSVFIGTKVGTPLYLSPEQVKQFPYDFKVDIWGIGCCLYHLASFSPPFIAENIISLGHMIVGAQPKPLSYKYYSSEFSDFVFRMLDKNS